MQWQKVLGSALVWGPVGEAPGSSEGLVFLLPKIIKNN